MKGMVIVKATKGSEAGEMPSEELLTAMGNYNAELVKAGIMKAGEGPLRRRRQATGDRRSVRRNKGADRWLLDLGGRVVARSNRLGKSLS